MSTGNRFKKLLEMILSTQEEDITCDECFEHVDRYADMLRAGDEPDRVMHRVRRHLENCDCCQREFEAFLLVLQGMEHEEQG